MPDNTEARYTKIRWDGKHVRIEHESRSGADRDDSGKTSSNPPLPEFVDALQAFGPLLVDQWGLPEAWEGEQERLEVRSVLANYRGADELLELQVCALKFDERSNSPLPLNTPPRREGKEGSENSITVLQPAWITAWETLCGEATRYIAGQRAQLELPGFGEEETEPTKETATV